MSTSTPRRVVLTGGSGFVGRAIVRHLLDRAPDVRVRVPTRDLASASRALRCADWLGTKRSMLELLEADIHDPRQAAEALRDADVLVQLVAILHGSPEAFERVHVTLQGTLAAAARQAGVRQVVQVSALGVSAQAPSHYLRSKFAGENVWRDAAARGSLGVDLLRPSVIFGAEDRFTNLFAQLLRWAPLLPLAGASSRFQPVWVEDVAAAVASLIERAPDAGAVRCHDAAGPRVLTLAQIVREIGRMSLRPRAVVPVPEAIGHAQAALLGLLPGPTLMSADNLLSMRVPNVAGSGPGLPALGLQPADLQIAAAWLDPRQARRRGANAP